MQLHAAIVGPGFVGRAHLEALRRLGIPVQGMLASTPERSKAAAESLHLPHAYQSLEELVEDQSVQLVHLCTPNNLHFAEASQLLRAGKHVLCEKPLALDSRESATLVSLLKDTGLVGAVTYNLRYYPLCQEARALVQGGAIGQVKLIHGSFLQDWLLFPTDWNWRLDAKLGGRTLAPADIQATLVALTVRTIADAIRTHCARATEILACGGGANNAAVMEALARELAPRTVGTTAALGVAVEHVEALAFAWLAREALAHRPGNLPEVTGARGLRVLGAIYPR